MQFSNVKISQNRSKYIYFAVLQIQKTIFIMEIARFHDFYKAVSASNQIFNQMTWLCWHENDLFDLLAISSKVDLQSLVFEFEFVFEFSLSESWLRLDKYCLHPSAYY